MTRYSISLSALDEYDVRRSFDALDDEKARRLSLTSLHTLYLGLGFEPLDLTLGQLRVEVMDAIETRRDAASGSTKQQRDLEDLQFLDWDDDYATKISDNENFIPLSIVLEVLAGHSRNRTREFQHTFRLLDQENKGYVTANDLQRVSQEAGEPLSTEETKILVENPLNEEAFQSVFAPPSPT